jgi:hypothetical protein
MSKRDLRTCNVLRGMTPWKELCRRRMPPPWYSLFVGARDRILADDERGVNYIYKVTMQRSLEKYYAFEKYYINLLYK